MGKEYLSFPLGMSVTSFSFVKAMPSAAAGKTISYKKKERKKESGTRGSTSRSTTAAGKDSSITHISSSSSSTIELYIIYIARIYIRLAVLAQDEPKRMCRRQRRFHTRATLFMTTTTTTTFFYIPKKRRKKKVCRFTLGRIGAPWRRRSYVSLYNVPGIIIWLFFVIVSSSSSSDSVYIVRVEPM